MSDDKTPEEVEDWAEKNFEAMKNRMEEIQEEMRNSKPRENINVRRVDSENLEGQDEDQVIVEHKVQRWYSINYFKRMMQTSEDQSENSGNEDEEGTLF